MKSATRITTPVPPLRDGDRMGVAEFLRRYTADPEVYSAELLNGVVYVTRRRVRRGGQEAIVPPISADGHASPQAKVIGWMMQYAAHTPGVAALGAVTTILPSQDTGLEPDAVLRVLPEHGGGSVVGPDKFIHGRPELIVEVSYTPGGRYLGPKYEAFETDGVPEYLVWRTDAGEVEWFTLKRKRYVRLKAEPDGVIRSAVFPGLWLDVPALMAGNMAQVLRVVQDGITSPERAAFVAKLAAKAARRRKK